MWSYLFERAALFKNKSFVYACIMNFCSAITVGVAYVSFSWYLLTLYNSLNAIIIFMFSWWVFGVFLSPITGYFADRFSRSSIIILTNFARMTLILFFLLFFSLDQLFKIYLFTGCWGIILAFYMPAMLALVREMFSDDNNLLYANSTIDGVFQIGMLLGISLGGFLMSILSIQDILYILLIGSFVAFLVSFGIKPARQVDTNKNGFIENWRTLWIFFEKKHFALWFYVSQVGFTCLFMVIPIFIAPYAKNILHASPWEFGLIETAFSIGFTIGCIVLPWLANRNGHVSVVVINLVMSSFLYLFLAIFHDVMLTIILYFFIGLAISSGVIITTLAQKNTDLSLQGKAQGIGYGLSGILVMIVYSSFFIANLILDIPDNNWFYFIIVLEALIVYPLIKGYNLQKTLTKSQHS